MKGKHDLHVLVMEPHAAGHHGFHLTWMVEALLEDGYTVTVQTTPDSAKHPGFAALSQLPADVVPMTGRCPVPELSVGKGAVALIKREFGYWRLFREWYRSFGAHTRAPDAVFLPYLDYCLYAIGVLGSPFGKTQWSGLAMRPSFHYASMGVIAPRPALAAIKHGLFMRTLGNDSLRLLFTIDEPFIEYSRQRGLGSDKIEFMPEPADFSDFPERREARQRLGLRQDGPSILLYGALTMRKGVDRLLEAALDPDFPAEVTLIVAGRADEDVKRYLQREEIQALISKGRIVLMDRFIAAEEEGLLFSAADAAWLGYVGHYNASGVLVQAARAGCPVIACKEGVLGWQTQRHHMGWTIDVQDHSDLMNAVRAVSENPEQVQTFGHNARLAYARHTREGSMDAMRDAFRVKFGQATKSTDDLAGKAG